MKSFSLPIKLLISLSILAVLAWRIHEDQKFSLSEIAAQLSIPALSTALLLLLGQFALLSMRWGILMNLGLARFTARDALRLNLVGQLGSLMFVTSLGGTLARAGLTMRDGAPLLKVFVASVTDRMLTVAALVLMAVLFLPFLPDRDSAALNLAVAAALAAGLAAGFLLTAPILRHLAANSLVKPVLRHRLRYAVRYLRILHERKFLFPKVAALSLSAQLLFFVSVYLLLHASAADIGFVAMMAVLPIVSLIAALPVSINGWGVREGAYVYGLGLLGVPMDTAFFVSVEVGLLGIAAILLAGLPALFASQSRAAHED